MYASLNIIVYESLTPPANARMGLGVKGDVEGYNGHHQLNRISVQPSHRRARIPILIRIVRDRRGNSSSLACMSFLPIVMSGDGIKGDLRCKRKIDFSVEVSWVAGDKMEDGAIIMGDSLYSTQPSPY